MKLTCSSLLIGLSLTSPALSQAATLLETTHEGGGTDKMYIDGMRMRIDSSNEPFYLLIDAGKGALYTVSPPDREIIDMTRVAQRGASRAPTRGDFKVQIQSKGAGPSIAGYATRHYIVSVNGQRCSEEYLSKKAIEDIGGVEAFRKIAALLSGVDMGMGQGMRDACDAADALVFQEYVGYGFPLKVIAADGSVDSLVVKIVKDAAMPPHGFELPKGYKVTDMETLMHDAPMTLPQDAPMDPETLQRMLEQMAQPPE